MKNGTERNGKFIAIANMKGGVGKTTTVVSLAEALAAEDLSARVLVIDLDPQASASLCLAGDDLLAEMIEDGRTLQDFLEIRLVDQDKKPPIKDFIRGFFSYTTHQGEQLSVSLLPCGPHMRLFERQLIYELTKRRFGMNAIEGHLWKLFQADFAPLSAQYDYVIFDCPPGISPFTEVAIRASDLVIVPTIPDRISNFGLNAFCLGLWRNDNSTLPLPPRPHVLISRMQENVRQHQIMMKRLEAETQEKDRAFDLFETRIPQSAALANALSQEGSHTFTKKYTLAVAQILGPLAQEIKELFNADRH